MEISKAGDLDILRIRMLSSATFHKISDRDAPTYELDPILIDILLPNERPLASILAVVFHTNIRGFHYENSNTNVFSTCVVNTIK